MLSQLNIHLNIYTYYIIQELKLDHIENTEITAKQVFLLFFLFKNLQNMFQVQESRISLNTMQSIIYRRIKYILYTADEPCRGLHMYNM